MNEDDGSKNSTKGGEDMTEEKIKEIIKTLDGISYHEWQFIDRAVEKYFDMKKSEFKRTLKLTCDDFEKTNPQQFV